MGVALEQIELGKSFTRSLREKAAFSRYAAFAPSYLYDAWISTVRDSQALALLLPASTSDA
jgi:hypothetical protein